jgi:hypothetical protein
VLERVVPPGGGLDSVTLKIDPAAGVVHVLRAGRDKSIPIPIEKSRIDASASTIEIVSVGNGRSVAHARIPDVQRKDLAFEVLVSAQSDDPIFAGLTGYTHGEEGDRSGQHVLVKDRDAQSKFVIVAETREDTRICGQVETPLGAQGIDPTRMQLVGATLPRIDKKSRENAQRVIAQPRTQGGAPLARVLVATGGSSPNAPALTDGKLETFWNEARTAGDGHGEFATMRAPTELPIHSFIVTIAPPKPKPDGAAPRTFFLAIDDRLLHVTMPEDAWLKPGLAYDVPLAKPVRTGCASGTS